MKNGVPQGQKLRGKKRYARLYHYTSFEAFVKIWLSKSLKFSCIKNVNDVIESIVSSEVSNPAQLPLLIAYQNLRLQYKQISLTMDYDTSLGGYTSACMWGYYADKKKGVCIELDYDRLVFSKDILKRPIVYKNKIKDTSRIPGDIITINQLYKFIEKNATAEFFTKHISWKGENEYRIISRTQEYLDISNAISTVYLTSFNSEECCLVEKLVNGEVPVKYLMYNSSNGYIFPDSEYTEKTREIIETAKTNPNNGITKFRIAAEAFYNKHKDDPDYPLIMQYS